MAMYNRQSGQVEFQQQTRFSLQGMARTECFLTAFNKVFRTDGGI